MWTLRDEKYCQNDFWVEVLQFLIKNKNTDEQISKNNVDEVKEKIINLLAESARISNQTKI